MIKIGYQGDVGSNSEAAAENFISKLKLDKNCCELFPLISSANVLKHLEGSKIDYGVMAVKNSTAGIVRETADAIRDKKLTVISSVTLPVHHCIFIKQHVTPEEITVIVSHPQALKQTVKNRKTMFEKWQEKEVEDTAIAARKLKENVYPDNYAVICRENAGKNNGLKMIAKNIEDNTENKTTFNLYKKSL